jgi:hypothetical protein
MPGTPTPSRHGYGRPKGTKTNVYTSTGVEMGVNTVHSGFEDRASLIFAVGSMQKIEDPSYDLYGVGTTAGKPYSVA